MAVQAHICLLFISLVLRWTLCCVNYLTWSSNNFIGKRKEADMLVYPAPSILWEKSYLPHQNHVVGGLEQFPSLLCPAGENKFYKITMLKKKKIHQISQKKETKSQSVHM